MNVEQRHELRMRIIDRLTFNQYKQVRAITLPVCLEDIGLERFKKITKDKETLKLYITLIGYCKLEQVS